MDSIDIRESRAEDIDSIMSIYPKAFPEEELRPVVKELLGDGAEAISLVGCLGDELAGHVIFTICSIGGSDKTAALLAPLAVDPVSQKRGVGGALVRYGFEALKKRNVSHVYVLGDPAYYGRFGFAPEANIAPPYPIPPEWREAWQSISLNGASPPPGKLAVPAPWRKPALWGP